MSHNFKTITIGNKTYDLSQVSEEEKWRLEHQKMHEMHKGHEKMHFEMFLILIVTLVVAQMLLVQWRKYYFKSYQIATLLGMWIIPVFFCLKLQWWRFLVTWFIFSCLTGMITYWSTRKPIAGDTPRKVYTYYVLVYKLSYGLGIIGYCFIMGTLFGFNTLFGVKPNVTMDIGLLFLFYGLYYGVVARDFAEVCSDKMAATIGYYTLTGVPTRRLDPSVCAVCNNSMDEDTPEDKVKLNCQHIFHEFCIRGWLIVGKKDTCPYCKEKVDFKKLFKNPWEKPHVLYGSLLDWIRYLVAWQPVIVMGVQGINWLLGLE